MMLPAVWTARETGASLLSDKCAGLVIISLVGFEQVAKVPLAKHNDMIQQSRLIEPISRSAYPFCHGDRAAVAGHECPSHEGGG